MLPTAKPSARAPQAKSEAVLSATLPDPALAMSRLPVPEQIRELILSAR